MKQLTSDDLLALYCVGGTMVESGELEVINYCKVYSGHHHKKRHHHHHHHHPRYHRCDGPVIPVVQNNG